MRLYGYLMFVTLVVAVGCNEDHKDTEKEIKKESSSSPKRNFIILLDIGSRVQNGNPAQAARDMAIIRTIYGALKTNMDHSDSSRLYFDVQDKLKLLAAPNWLCAGVDFSAEPPARKELLAEKTDKIFSSSLPDVYQAAVNGNADPSGSDIWQYFNDYLADDIDKDAQNTLFVITDGYMTPKKAGERPTQKNRFASGTVLIDTLKKYPDWESRFTKDDYGLLPVAKKFNNLRVILLEVNPRPDWPSEYNLLTKTWSKWLTEMGISNYNFIKNDSASLVATQLGKLMNIKIDTALANKSTSPANIALSASAPATVVKAVDSVKSTVVKKDIAAPPPVPVANNGNERKTTLPAVTGRRPKATTAEVVPPDESDARILGGSKPKPAATRPNGKDDGDILQDGGAANGFNTGIKKNNKKDN